MHALPAAGPQVHPGQPHSQVGPTHRSCTPSLVLVNACTHACVRACLACCRPAGASWISTQPSGPNPQILHTFSHPCECVHTCMRACVSCLLQARRCILDIHTAKWAQPPSPSLRQELAAHCAGYCGADLKALCAEAALAALRRRCVACCALAISNMKEWKEALRRSFAILTRRGTSIEGRENIHKQYCRVFCPLAALVAALALPHKTAQLL
eukprot:1138839-Pelagomonas_calceolata.AAC.6